MSFFHALANNAFQVDAKKAEDELRSKSPKVLKKGERVELAFQGRGGMGRDTSYFTTDRILVKDGKGIGGKRKKYSSIPYWSIRAFSVETAGKVLDGDMDVKIWTDGNAELKIQFAKNQMNLWHVQQLMNDKVFAPLEIDKKGEDTVVSSNINPEGMGSLTDFLGNAKQLDPKAIEVKFKSSYPMLLPSETVELAFQAGRDFTLFTSHRIMIVDVKGVFGKKIEFESYKWDVVSGFCVETAGQFLDIDTDMRLYTNLMQKPVIKQDFREGKADIFAIQKVLANKVLGKDESAVAGVEKHQGRVDPDTSWWGRSNNRPLDAQEVGRVYKSNPPILQGSEIVEMAFKGRRDMVLFTTKRLVLIDPQGLSGRKIEYKSIPWKSVVAFGVETAGKHLDNDGEAKVWTDMMYDPANEDEEQEEDLPGMSFFEMDFNKNLVDLYAIKKYLSSRVLMGKPGLKIPVNNIVVSSAEQGMEAFVSKLGDDQRAIDPNEMNTIFHKEVNMLLDDEHVCMAFKAGRDVTLFTNHRIIEIDVKGWSGKKAEYNSVPYSSIRAFSAESAGGWDRDAEVDLFTRNTWTMKRFKQDFRKGKVDIVMIQKFLAAVLLGNQNDRDSYTASGAPAIESVDPAKLKHFMSWITSNSVEEDPVEFDQRFHHEPPILLEGERVKKAYKNGRDWWIYTTHRLLIIDVQGLMGRKVEYKSIPLQWMRGFAVETAGHMDTDAELYIYTDITSKRKMQQDLLVKRGDILDLHAYMSEFLLTSE